MAASVDAGYVSAFLQIPESSITSVLNAPTVELVQAVLQAVSSKAHEFEDAQADKLRLEIELENAIRRSDTQAQSLKASVDKALEETNTIRIRLNQEGDSMVSSSSLYLYLRADRICSIDSGE